MRTVAEQEADLAESANRVRRDKYEYALRDDHWSNGDIVEQIAKCSAAVKEALAYAVYVAHNDHDKCDVALSKLLAAIVPLRPQMERCVEAVQMANKFADE